MSQTRFPPLARDDMSDEQKALHDRIANGPRGGVRGPYPALLRHPELAKVQEEYGHLVRYRNSLPEALKELAILVTARHWSAQYEWFAHRQLAEKQGVSPAICDAIALGEPPVGLDDDASAIFDFTSQLLSMREVSDANFARVKDRFGDRGVLDLIALIGNYTTVALILNVDKHPIPSDATPLPKLG